MLHHITLMVAVRDMPVCEAELGDVARVVAVFFSGY